MPYHLTNNDWTVFGLAREMADGNSNDTPDGHVTLYLSPIYGPGHEPGHMAAWISTNGNPVLLATYDRNGEPLWDDAEQEWWGETLAYFDLDSTEELNQAVQIALER